MQCRDLSGRMGRDVLHRVRRRRFDAVQRRRTDAALAALAASAGAVVSSRDRHRAQQYAGDVLGSPHYDRWLLVYTAVRGEFVEGWIPDDYYLAVIAPTLDHGTSRLTLSKTLTSTFLPTEEVPTLAHVVGGILYSPAWQQLDLHDLHAAHGSGDIEVYVKPDGGMQGTGLHRVALSALTWDILRRVGDCTIQRAVTSHPDLHRLTPESVATLRVVTTRIANPDVTTRAAILRLGRADTGWVQSARSVRVAVTDPSGALDRFGYLDTWVRCTEHPDSHLPFGGMVIPAFTSAEEKCCSLHRALPPHFAVVGWDVAIDDTGNPVILECNVGVSVAFQEATLGPCFTDLGWETLHRRH